MKLLPKFNRSLFCLTFITAGVLWLALPQSVFADELVYDFGQGDWYSWDTRNSSGTQLVGTNDTSPAWPGTHTAADDTAIEKQIVFMGEGQTVNDEAGRSRPAGPTGSLNGLGYVRLDGTSANSGKSDISYVDTNGIAASSTLTDAGFGLSYRYYIDAGLSFRTLGLNISITDSSQTNLYTFAYVDPAAVTGWNTSSVGATSGTFRLIVNGTAAESGALMTLADWANDPTYGSAVFGSGEEIFRVGFNIGSSQHDGLQYLDWMQTNLLNGGDTIDFVDPSVVPEPATWFGSVLVTGTLGLLAVRRRRAGIRE